MAVFGTIFPYGSWALSLRTGRCVTRTVSFFEDQHRERGGLDEAIRDDGGDFAQSPLGSPLRAGSKPIITITSWA